ncbi:MAG: rhomboid family intramembrane serine protease [Ignavibacteria bacterium]|nr:rhomboid family intramembrane serine protease [Ignavibacteria bacterium]
MKEYNLQNSFKVQLNDINFPEGGFVKFFSIFAKTLGYEIYVKGENLIEANIASPPTNIIFNPRKYIEYVKLVNSLPAKFTVLLAPESVIFDFDFSENTGLFVKRKLKGKIDNFIQHLYRIREEVSDEEIIATEEFVLDNTISTLNVFTGKQTSAIVTIFLLISIVVYYGILVLFNGGNVFDIDPEILLNFGGNFPTKTLNGEAWRLFSSIFVHSDLEHLLGNLVALLSIGTLLEPKIGNIRFFLAFITTGVIGASISTLNNHFYISVGASGATLGLYGIFLVLLIFKKTHLRRNVFFDVLSIVIFTLASGLFDPEVDNSGHFGGFISGIIFGLLFLIDFKTAKQKFNFAGSLIIALITLVVSTYVVKTTPDYRSMFLEILKETDELSNSSQTYFELLKEPSTFDDSTYLRYIDSDLSKWNEALNKLNSAYNLKLGKEQIRIVNYLKEYYSTWKDAYNIIRQFYSGEENNGSLSDSLVVVYYKLTEIIKRDKLVVLPDVWIPHNFIFIVRKNKFVDDDEKALEYYRLLSNDAPVEKLIESLENGKKIWENTQSYFSGFDTLNIAEEYKIQYRLLVEYLKLRIESYSKLLDYYKNNNKEAFNEYNKLVDAIVNTLGELRKANFR